ncbi:hypothetical protein ACTQ33_05225 [Candidatus Avoscillospira sp. LCP25S3_F1]
MLGEQPPALPVEVPIQNFGCKYRAEQVIRGERLSLEQQLPSYKLRDQ